MNPANTAKAQVIDWVRSKNPQTMELKFGCRIQRENGCIEIINNESSTLNGGQMSYSTNKSTFFDNLYTADNWQYEKGGMYWATRNGGEKCRILGSDMGLQELLIALQTLPISHGQLYGTEELEKHEYGCKHCGGELTDVHPIGWKDGVIDKYDLTKNLHQQEPNFYESILPLIQ